MMMAKTPGVRLGGCSFSDFRCRFQAAWAGGLLLVSFLLTGGAEILIPAAVLWLKRFRGNHLPLNSGLTQSLGRI